jgi:hypothetical protein
MPAAPRVFSCDVRPAHVDPGAPGNHGRDRGSDGCSGSDGTGEQGCRGPGVQPHIRCRCLEELSLPATAHPLSLCRDVVRAVRSVRKLHSGDPASRRTFALTYKDREPQRTTIILAANVEAEIMILHSRKMHSVLARSNNNGITKDCITGEKTCRHHCTYVIAEAEFGIYLCYFFFLFLRYVLLIQ